MLGQDICLVICGNKSDMEKNRTVKQADAEAYAESVGAVHFLTSAKLNRGIDDMFLDLSKRMLSKPTPSGSSSGGGGNERRRTSGRNVLQVIDDSGPSNKNGIDIGSSSEARSNGAGCC